MISWQRSWNVQVYMYIYLLSAFEYIHGGGGAEYFSSKIKIILSQYNLIDTSSVTFKIFEMVASF